MQLKKKNQIETLDQHGSLICKYAFTDSNDKNSFIGLANQAATYKRHGKINNTDHTPNQLLSMTTAMREREEKNINNALSRAAEIKAKLAQNNFDKMMRGEQ